MSPPGWEAISLLPEPLPAFERQSVDTSTQILGQTFRAPVLLKAPIEPPGRPQVLGVAAAAAARHGLLLFLTGATGTLHGPAEVERLRSTLAGAGSPRVLMEITSSWLVEGHTREDDRINGLLTRMNDIEAAGFVVRLDLSEPKMPPGDPSRVLNALADLAARVNRRLLVSAAAGMTRAAARTLLEHGAAGLIAGSSLPFRDADQLGPPGGTWGIPAFAAIRILRGIGVPVASDGRIESGLSAAKAIALGADLVVTPAQTSTEPLDRFLDDLRAAMYLSGAPTLAALKHVPFVATGATREWLEAAETLWRTDSVHG
jgi:isopentenyl-diphosphate delta-isomerase